MKKFLLALALFSGLAFAEASFQQIEGLIEQKNYAAAEAGLEGIIVAHPQSAKAFYAMAQAQAGLGHLEKAQYALNKAKGLDPELKFASSSNIQSLEQAITPQTAKIEVVEESHTVRNTILVIFILALGYVGYTVYRRNKEADEAYEAQRHAQWAKEMDEAQARHDALVAERAEARRKEEEAEAALRAHKNYGHERFDPANPDKLKPVKQFKAEQEAAKQAAELREARARADAAEASARMYRTSAQTVAQPTTTVVNNSSNDMLTGIMIGNMMSGSHHDHTTVIERDVVREVPAPSRDSSWDTPAPSSSRSSSWDNDSSSSSSKSSSWDSDSSSSSSSWSSSSSSDSSWSSSDSSSSSSSDW